MIKKIATFFAGNRGLMDVAGFCCLVGAAYIEFGLAPALAAAGVTLFAVRYLLD